MRAIYLFSYQGYERQWLPEARLECVMGESLFGRPALWFRSGWLYPAEGFHFAGGETILQAGFPGEYVLRGGEEPMALLLREEEEVRRAYSLAGVDSFSAGSASANAIVYRDSWVSRCHGRFSREGKEGFAYAELSTNGSYVNGKLIRGERVSLAEGDEVLIPPSLRLRLDGDRLELTCPVGTPDCSLPAWKEDEK